ncbi:MAG: hypothetical protein ACOYJ2_02620 [Rickettsiales bacterium]
MASEGNYSERDRDGLPALHGITAQTWMEWVNDHNLGRDPVTGRQRAITRGEAATDLTTIWQNRNNGQGGRYTAITANNFRSTYFPEITYQAYFVDAGLAGLNSDYIEQYMTEIAYHRGVTSAKWSMLYATGTVPRHADPLLDRNLDMRGIRMDDAVDLANGFLATGDNRTRVDGATPIDRQALSRLYGRLRLPK